MEWNTSGYILIDMILIYWEKLELL